MKEYFVASGSKRKKCSNKFKNINDFGYSLTVEKRRWYHLLSIIQAKEWEALAPLVSKDKTKTLISGPETRKLPPEVFIKQLHVRHLRWNSRGNQTWAITNPLFWVPLQVINNSSPVRNSRALAQTKWDNQLVPSLIDQQVGDWSLRN